MKGRDDQFEVFMEQIVKVYNTNKDPLSSNINEHDHDNRSTLINVELLENEDRMSGEVIEENGEIQDMEEMMEADEENLIYTSQENLEELNDTFDTSGDLFD